MKLRRRGEGGGDGLESGEEVKQEHIGRGRATATTTSGCSGVQALTNLSTVAESEKENAGGMNSRRSGVGQIENNGSPAAGAKAVLSVHPHDIIINLARGQ